MPKTGERIELGDVEHRGVQADDEGRDLGAAMLGEVGEVGRQHRPGEAGAEAQREGAGQHGPQRAIHLATA